MPLAELTWQSLRWLPIAVIAAAAGVGCTWWLYASQLRLRTRGVRWGLPLLRSIALLALAAALVKPVVLRAMSASDRGALVVLLDRSASMSVVDSNRTPAQLIALADGLKLLPAAAAPLAPAITQEDVDQIRAQADRITRAASELDYARLANRGVDAAQNRLDESIAQLATLVQPILNRARLKPKSTREIERLGALIAVNQKDRPAWLRELSQRVERVGSLATDAENNSAEQLYRGNIEVRAVCDRLAKMSRLELAKLAVTQSLGHGPAPMDVYEFAGAVSPLELKDDSARHAESVAATQPLDPSGNTSDLTSAVRTVLQHYPSGGVSAVVLLSDGRQVGSETTLETLAASAGEVPVYTVRMARSGSPKDLSIGKATAPARAFVGETLNVRVEVRSAGIRGEAPVTLTAGTVTQTKPVIFVEDGLIPVEFSVKLDKPGPLRLGISVAPQAAEISTANNSIERWVNVLSDKVHVVTIAQSAGRDFQFLRDALARTAWVKLDESVAASPDSRAGITAEQLADADVIILEDAGPKLLSPEQWAQVRKLVAERGAGAILLAGESHLPGELLTQPDAAQLLPIDQSSAATWHTWGGEWPTLRAVPGGGVRGSGFGVQGEETNSHATLPEALRLADDGDTSLRKWQELPAMYRLLDLAPLKANALPLLVDADNHAAVATVSRLGAGSVAYIGMNETWRWRYKVGQRDQERFWLQLVRQVADEPYAVTAGGVSIDADHIAIGPGKPLKLRMRLRDAAGVPAKEPAVKINVKGLDGSTREETLTAVSPESGRYEKTVNDWTAGAYELSFAGAPEPRLTVHVTEGLEAEMANLSGDDRLMRRIADVTGGQSLGPEHLADLPAELASTAAQHPRVAEVRLWDSPYLFALVLACLGLEWAVRKQAGLA